MQAIIDKRRKEYKITKPRGEKKFKKVEFCIDRKRVS